MSEYDHMMRGGKVGTGAPASAQYEAIDRRERLRRMALEVRNNLALPTTRTSPVYRLQLRMTYTRYCIG
jgi:hypothetical protein